jgi:hypothetical protein
VSVTEYAVLCQVPAGLADHVVQLLADADVASQKAIARREGHEGVADPTAKEPLFLVVPKEDMDRARSVVGLVLPQLLDPQSSKSGLADRLVRSDDAGMGGRADQPTDGGLPDNDSDSGGGITPLPVWRGPSRGVLDEPDDAFHDEEGNYVPPAPPPIPRPKDSISRFAWAAVIGGPLLAMISIALGLDGIFSSAGLLMFFGGFGTLVARRPDHKPHEDDLGNGAVLYGRATHPQSPP